MKIIRENMGTVIRGRDKVIEKERKRQSCEEGKKWAPIRMRRQIEGQNNNRGENKMLALAACCKTFILSVCVSVGAAGCQVTSGQRSRRERRD